MSLTATSDPVPVASRYFVAKHIPDLARYEPRNVGVILWTEAGAFVRFAGERSDGSLDLRSCPSFLEDPQVYKQWVDYWKELTSGQEALTSLCGPLASVDDQLLSGILSRASKEHWLLTPGGMLIDPVKPEEIPILLNRLYSEIVSGEESRLPTETVDQIVRAVVRALSLNRNPHFHEDYHLKVRNGDNLHFDYAFAGTRVEKLWQRLPTMPRPSQLEPYAEAAAYKFSEARTALDLSGDNLCAVVSMNTQEEKANQHWLRLVARHAQVFNLNDPAMRFSAFEGLPVVDVLEGTELRPGPVTMRPPVRSRQKS